MVGYAHENSRLMILWTIYGWICSWE